MVNLLRIYLLTLNVHVPVKEFRKSVKFYETIKLGAFLEYPVYYFCVLYAQL